MDLCDSIMTCDLDGKGKKSKVDQKPPGEEQSKKRFRQWVSHVARLKWSLWTELVGGSEWRPYAPRGAKNKKKKRIYPMIQNETCPE